MKNYLKKIGFKSKEAFKNLNNINSDKRNKVLETYNKELGKKKIKIIKENERDIKRCKRKDMIDRLIIDKNKIEAIRFSLNEISKFKDPLGKIINKWKRPNGLTIKKVSIPIGVIGVIYESRPDVTPYVSSLCLKSGNVAILKGGSEAIFSNAIFSNLFRDSLKKNNVEVINTARQLMMKTLDITKA